jgi:hypothetical protein
MYGLISDQMLSRHGSRYPTTGQNVDEFGNRIANAAGKFKATGALSFLNSWKYQLGAEILVPKGMTCLPVVLRTWTDSLP